MIRRPPRSTHCISSAASDVYKRQNAEYMGYDITEQVLNEQKMNSAIITFVNDITNPMKGALYYLDQIKLEDIMSQNKMGDLKLSIQVLKELQVSIDDIMSLAKETEHSLQIQPDILDIEKNINEVIRILDPIKLKDVEIKLIMQIDEVEKKIHNDGSRIKQLLYCLLNHSLKNISQGLIEIYVQSESFTSDSLQLSIIETRINNSQNIIQKSTQSQSDIMTKYKFYNFKQILKLVGPSKQAIVQSCLLYTSDAADDMQCVDLGGRRIIKKKTPKTHQR
eukprot:TRINITY_DN10272_c0_g2_i1.p1 TRINITY_DN10272_c0_g2~~TRINITY_DN10272_c0_g2_i1.p1  ORF type:complete len:279 (-),score=66.31 TRINITY_DN10272_c0_g2_i1:75-911(-)